MRPGSTVSIPRSPYGGPTGIPLGTREGTVVASVRAAGSVSALRNAASLVTVLSVRCGTIIRPSTFAMTASVMSNAELELRALISSMLEARAQAHGSGSKLQRELELRQYCRSPAIPGDNQLNS